MRLVCCIIFTFSVVTSVTAWAQTRPSFVILQYHHVSSSTPSSTSLSPDEFAAHMRWLQENEFNVIRLEEAIEAVQSGTPLSDHTAVISFDDAYSSIYTEAFPVLHKLSYPFTIFTPAGLIGDDNSVYASWEELRVMAANGGTIANHSMHHDYYLERQTNEDKASWLRRIREDILQAEEKIKAETGQEHHIFAWPYGEYSHEMQDLIREMNFVGVGQQSGAVNSYSDFTALPRFPLSGLYANMDTFAIKMFSLGMDYQLLAPRNSLTRESSPEVTLHFKNGIPMGLSCFNQNKLMHLTINSSAKKVVLSSTDLNTSRRFRYNCTAPAENGRYYWMSVAFVTPKRH